MALPTTITGIATSPACVGPFISSGGNVYFFGRDSSTATTLQCFKATDPTSSFSSVATQTGFSTAVQGIAGDQVGDTIYLAILDGTDTSANLKYRTFDMSSDSFGTSETVHSAMDIRASTGASSFACGIGFRGSDSQPIILYNGPRVSNMGNQYARIVYARRTGVNTWTTNVAVDGGSTVNWILAEAAKGSSDRMHFFWYQLGSSLIFNRTLTSANALQTASSGDGGFLGGASGLSSVSYDASGTQKLACAADDITNGNFGTLFFNSADNPTENVGTEYAATTPIRLFNDGTDMWALYRKSADSDLYVRKSTDHGSTFGTEEAAFTGITVGAADANLSKDGNIFTRGSSVVIPYVVNDNGTLKYNEYVVRTLGSTGSASGTGAASGVGASTAATPGSIAGTGAASGVGASTAATAGTAAGTGDASAVGSVVAATDGTATGAGAASGTGAAIFSGDGSATGAGAASGAGASTAASDGAASGTGGASGTGASTAEAAGSSSGTGIATGEGTGIKPIDGTASGTGSATATGAPIGAGAGSASGTGTATAEGTTGGGDQGAGSAAGAGSATAVGSSTAASAGAAEGTGAASGVGAATAAAAGSASGVGDAIGTGASTGAGSGSSAGTGTATATGSSTAASTGTAAGAGDATATGSSTAVSTGSAAGAGDATAPGRALIPGAGSAAGAGDATAVGSAATAGVGSAAGAGAGAGLAISSATGSATGTGAATGAGSTIGFNPGTGTAAGTCSAEAVSSFIKDLRELAVTAARNMQVTDGRQFETITDLRDI